MLDNLFPGCDHSGVTYKNGDIFSPTGDPCDMCTCQVIIISDFEANIVWKVIDVELHTDFNLFSYWLIRQLKLLIHWCAQRQTHMHVSLQTGTHTICMHTSRHNNLTISKMFPVCKIHLWQADFLFFLCQIYLTNFSEKLTHKMTLLTEALLCWQDHIPSSLEESSSDFFWLELYSFNIIHYSTVSISMSLPRVIECNFIGLVHLKWLIIFLLVEQVKFLLTM